MAAPIDSSRVLSQLVVAISQPPSQPTENKTTYKCTECWKRNHQKLTHARAGTDDPRPHKKRKIADDGFERKIADNGFESDYFKGAIDALAHKVTEQDARIRSLEDQQNQKSSSEKEEET